MPRRAGRPAAGLADAPGRPLPARVPRACASRCRSSSCAATSSARSRSRSSRSTRSAREAVIFFSDIFVPIPGMGVERRLPAGARGGARRSARARRSSGCACRDPRESVPFVFEILRRAARASSRRASIPLIGFAGAPFTLAAYLVRGRAARAHFAHLQAHAAGASPTSLRALLDAAHRPDRRLPERADRGGRAGRCSSSTPGRDAARRGRLPRVGAARRTARSRRELDRARAPLILYVNDGAHLLDAMLETGADVLSLDWRVDLADAARRAGRRASLQGNLDPCALARRRARRSSRACASSARRGAPRAATIAEPRATAACPTRRSRACARSPTRCARWRG